LQIACESYCKSPEVDVRQLLRPVGQIHACSNPKEQAANLVRHKSHRFAEPALRCSYASASLISSLSFGVNHSVDLAVSESELRVTVFQGSG
jgi:hypothetical protein